MFPFVRLGKVVATARTRPPLGPLDDSVIELRVWPGDLDQNRHLNNGRYLTMMDIGRFDLVARTGLMKHLLKNRWYPVVTAATIRFRRAIDAFQTYELRTRILAWDDEAFFIEQRFERGGKVHAIAVIRGLFLGRDGKVPTARLVHLIDPEAVSPPIPEWVATWDRSQRELSASLKA